MASGHTGTAALNEALARIEWVYAADSAEDLRDRYDVWAEVYDRHVQEALGYTGAQRAAAELARLLPASVRVLDAGAGTGLVGAALNALGFSRICAVDLSPRMIGQARAKAVYDGHVVADIGHPLPFDPEFDAVIACGVFTIGHAPARAIGNLLDVLRPDGLLCLTLRADSTAVRFHEELSRLETLKRATRPEFFPPFRCFSEDTGSTSLQIVLCRRPGSGAGDIGP